MRQESRNELLCSNLIIKSTSCALLDFMMYITPEVFLWWRVNLVWYGRGVWFLFVWFFFNEICSFSNCWLRFSKNPPCGSMHQWGSIPWRNTGRPRGVWTKWACGRVVLPQSSCSLSWNYLFHRRYVDDLRWLKADQSRTVSPQKQKWQSKWWW